MELKAYGAILLRRWWIIVGVLALATAIGVAGVALVPPSTTYQATVRIAVYPEPEPRTGDYYRFDGYYAVVASEYLNDDLIELIRTGSFVQAVQERARAETGVAPEGSFDAKKAHRLVTIIASSSTADGAMTLARVAGEMLTDSTGAEFVNQLSPTSTVATMVDPPALSGMSSRRAMADIAIRAMLGLIAGVALAFLVDYLDDSLRSQEDVERVIGVPVIGVVPRLRPQRSRGATAGAVAPDSGRTMARDG